MPESERPNLTATQWAVLARVAAGQDNAAIATALGMLPKTVKNHLTRIYRQVPREPAPTKRAAVSTWYLRVGYTYHEGARDDARVGAPAVAPDAMARPGTRGGGRR